MVLDFVPSSFMFLSNNLKECFRNSYYKTMAQTFNYILDLTLLEGKSLVLESFKTLILFELKTEPILFVQNKSPIGSKK